MLFRFWVDQIKLGTIGKLMRCCKQPLECVLASFPGRKPVNEARMFVGVVSYAMLQWHVITTVYHRIAIIYCCIAFIYRYIIVAYTVTLPSSHRHRRIDIVA